jgi:hypothetical protein
MVVAYFYIYLIFPQFELHATLSLFLISQTAQHIQPQIDFY